MRYKKDVCNPDIIQLEMIIIDIVVVMTLSTIVDLMNALIINHFIMENNV